MKRLALLLVLISSTAYTCGVRRSAEGWIGPAGGTIGSPDVAVAVGPNICGNGSWVKTYVWEADDLDARAIWADTTTTYPKENQPANTYVLNVAFHGCPPPGPTVRVWWNIPARSGLLLWAGIPQDPTNWIGAIEYIPLETGILNGTYYADVPVAAFEVEPDLIYHAKIVAAPFINLPAPRGGVSVTHICPLPSCGTIIRGFSSLPTDHPVLSGKHPHFGIDFRAPLGTRVGASAGGIVVRSDYSSSFGNVVIIRHDDGSGTLYAHLSERLVSVNEFVDQDEMIGRAGATPANRVTGPHLHYEMVTKGLFTKGVLGGRIDPMTVLVVLKTVTVSASQSNFNGACCWGTLNAIVWDGHTEAFFGEYAATTATISGVLAGSVHDLRIGYAGGPVPQDALGGYLVDASLTGGTWEHAPGQGYADGPSFDEITLTPTWYPNLIPYPEGIVWFDYRVTINP